MTVFEFVTLMDENCNRALLAHPKFSLVGVYLFDAQPPFLFPAIFYLPGAFEGSSSALVQAHEQPGTRD